MTYSLPSFFAKNQTSHGAHLQMMGMVNAMERTYDQFKVVLEASGWKIAAVHANDAWPSVFPHIEAVVA
jgi:hypothetical protein